MDIFQQIHDDHVKVNQLLGQMKSQPEREPERWTSQLQDLLLPHAKAEETTLYAMLQEFDEARLHLLGASEEHAVAEALLDTFEDAGDDPERFVAKVAVLQTLLQHHIEEEEGRTFDFARSLLSRDQIQDLSQQFTDQKERFQKQWPMAA